MRLKREEIRKKMREDDINERKQNIRVNLIREITQEKQIEDINNDLLNFIKLGDVDQYLGVYTRASKSLLKSLHHSTIENSYQFISKDINENKNALVLRHFLPNHLHLILTHKFEQLNKANIYASINQINRSIYESNTLSEVEDYICILNYLYLGNEAKRNKNQSLSHTIDMGSIVGWFSKMYRSTSYMYLLHNIASHVSFKQAWWDHQNKEGEHYLIIVLARQALSDSQHISFLSIHTLNTILNTQYPYSQLCVRNLMLVLLQALNHVFHQFEEGKPYFNDSTLMLSLASLQKVLKMVADRKYNINISELLLQSQAYKLISHINELHYLSQRHILYSILNYSLQIALIQAHRQALRFIGNELKQTIILGLGNKFSNPITIQSLKSIRAIFCHQLHIQDQKKLINEYVELGMLQILEYLQFNMNMEISQQATFLLSCFDQIHAQI